MKLARTCVAKYVPQLQISITKFWLCWSPRKRIKTASWELAHTFA